MDIEARVARLERVGPEIQNMRNELYQDYINFDVKLDEAAADLAAAKRAKTAAVKTKKDAEKVYNDALVLLIDQSPERLAGKNEDLRKQAKDRFMVEVQSPGGELHSQWLATIKAEYALLDAETEESIAIDHYSGLRYIVRLAAGLAHSLG